MCRLGKDRLEGGGGGCATFVREGVPYRVVEVDLGLECVVVEIWVGSKNIMVVNLYNPCREVRVRAVRDVGKGQWGVLCVVILMHIIYCGVVRVQIIMEGWWRIWWRIGS